MQAFFIDAAFIRKLNGTLFHLPFSLGGELRNAVKKMADFFQCCLSPYFFMSKKKNSLLSLGESEPVICKYNFQLLSSLVTYKKYVWFTPVTSILSATFALLNHSLKEKMRGYFSILPCTQVFASFVCYIIGFESQNTVFQKLAAFIMQTKKE